MGLTLAADALILMGIGNIIPTLHHDHKMMAWLEEVHGLLHQLSGA